MKRKWEEKKGEVREGDWLCAKCGVNNWANRDKCFKCKKSKVDKEPKRDWFCELCKAPNFPNRFSCFRCCLSKPDEEWEGKRQKNVKTLYVHPACMPYTEDATGDTTIFHPAALHSRCTVNRPPPKTKQTKLAPAVAVDPVDDVYSRAFQAGVLAGKTPEAQTTESDWPSFPSVVERYYTEYFYVANRCEQYVHKHSNGLCLLGLASGHPALQNGRKIVKVNWNVGNSDRSVIEVSGKKKKGALWLDAHSLLCELTCSDDSTYTLQTGVHGKLIEINSRLPEVLTPETAEGDGWLAIIMLKKVDMAANSHLLTKTGYQAYRQCLQQELHALQQTGETTSSSSR